MSAHFHLILCISSRPDRFATGRTILSPMRRETQHFSTPLRQRKGNDRVAGCRVVEAAPSVS